MAGWAIKNFGGEVPKTDSRLLPNDNAEQAVNCDLSSGNLAGLPILNFIIDLSGTAGTQRAYRFPVPGLPDTWLPLPSPYSSVCRSPLANDTLNRLYWTNPANSTTPGAFWSTQAMIAANTPPYSLGTIYPGAEVTPTTALGVTSSGGVVVPLVVRSYVFTYVNQYGEESAPSEPSALVTGNSDGTWAITGLPTAAPSNPVGFNYPTITGVNLYRTLTGTTTGAAFYQVTQFVYGTNSPPTSYADVTLDIAIVNNTQLISTSFSNPPVGLDGLITFPGGMLIGFVGNTVYFCEPDRPFAWPVGYAQSLGYQIMGFGVWQQSLVTLTSGFPSSGTGNSPTNFTFIQVRVPEPCISRGSVITDLMGVYYASQNGLVMLNYFGMQNQTLATVTKNIWLARYAATTLLACRHRAQYLALRMDGSNTGFLIDYAEQRLGFMELSLPAGITAVWNDEYTGDAYMCKNGRIHRWDDPTTASLIYRWRSKQFYGAAPLSMGAVQISSDPTIATATASTSDDLPSDPSLMLPAGVNAVFNMYVGGMGDASTTSTDVPDANPTATPVFTRPLKIPREIFRLPSGFKAFDYQFEIVSRVPVHSIEVATTMKELKGV